MRIVYFFNVYLLLTSWCVAQEISCPSIGSLFEFGIKQDTVIRDNSMWFNDILDSGFVINSDLSVKAFTDTTCLLELAKQVEKQSENYPYRCFFRSSSFIWANMDQWANIDSVFENESTKFLQLRFFRYDRTQKSCEIAISKYFFDKAEKKYTSKVELWGYGLCELKP